MRKRKLIPALALALALLCGVTIGASAAGGLQEITAYLSSGITVTMDGEAQTFLDADGTRVYPVVYNGTTYLPIRAVAGLVGLDVDWDQATQTVKLGKQPNGVDLIDTYKAYQFVGSGDRSWAGQIQTSNEKTEDIGGVTRSHWLYFGTASWVLGDASASFNLQGKHDTLTFSYFSNLDTTLTVLGDDGMVLGEYSITGGAVPKTVTISLFKTSELKFQVQMTEGNTNVRIFDAYLDAE